MASWDLREPHHTPLRRSVVSSKAPRTRSQSTLLWNSPIISFTLWTERSPIMSKLADRECVPCKGGIAPLESEKLAVLENELGHDWRVVHEHHLEKEFTFANFREALRFTNQIGNLADEVGHHPDIYLAWGKVKITLWTHKI